MKRTNYVGYWNVTRNPREPVCYRIDTLGHNYHVDYDGTETLQEFNLVPEIEKGDWVPSLWLPPGVRHNPAVGNQILNGYPIEYKDVNPINEEVTDEASRFVNLTAMEILYNLAMEYSPQASDNVRLVYPRPSLLDRAIAERVLELLT